MGVSVPYRTAPNRGPLVWVIRLSLFEGSEGVHTWDTEGPFRVGTKSSTVGHSGL